MIKIPKHLFDLSEEQTSTSKMIYDGKIIRCLVAPYHSFEQLEKVISYTSNCYLFPEKEATANQMRSFVSLLVANKNFNEFNIVTASQSIIIDMVNDCVRILTERNDIVPCPTKTFMANIHDIRYNVLENPAHELSQKERSAAKERIDKLIDKIISAKTLTQKQYEATSKEIALIGEPLISRRLMEMLNSKHYNIKK